MWVKDARRSIDYIETREDLDDERIAISVSRSLDILADRRF
jgi:hypothetical protein